MQQHKKFRSPEQGYSRRAMKARTSRAIQLTLEDDLEMDVHDLGDDSIAQLMRGPPQLQRLRRIIDSRRSIMPCFGAVSRSALNVPPRTTCVTEDFAAT